MMFRRYFWSSTPKQPWLQDMLRNTSLTFQEHIQTRVRTFDNALVPRLVPSMYNALVVQVRAHESQWKDCAGWLQKTRSKTNDDTKEPAGTVFVTCAILAAGCAFMRLDGFAIVFTTVAIPLTLLVGAANVVRDTARGMRLEAVQASREPFMKSMASAGQVGQSVEEIADQWATVWAQVRDSVDDKPRSVEWETLFKLKGLSEEDLQALFGKAPRPLHDVPPM